MLASTRRIGVAVAAIVVVALAFRCHALDYGGFSEDEVNKINAVRAYEHGDFVVNAEHPFLMKAAMTLSVVGARAWNAVVAPSSAWSPEAALRLPNAIVGALIAVPLFLLVSSFFGRAAGLWAALFWALDVNATGVNRIGKEDTFFLFFLLLGAWCYERARTLHLERGVAPDAWYLAAGAAFGLMAASKYMVYYLGLWAVFVWAAGQRPSPQRATGWFYLAIPAAFLIANPIVLLPGTWHYLLGYVSGHTITHHGAFFDGRLYMNMVETTPFGLPWYYYLECLALKVPLAVLAAIAAGLVGLWRRRRERGATFVRVFLVLFLLPGSLFASKFLRYLLPVFAVLDIVAGVGLAWLLACIASRVRPRLVRACTAGLVVAVAVGSPLVVQATAAPYPSLFLNAVGRRVVAPGSLVPDDELYDMGMRAAVLRVAQAARPGAALVSDAPAVVAEYIRRAGRSDLSARSLSMAGLPAPPTDTWVLVEDGHLCFESIQTIENLRRRQRPEFVVHVDGARAVEVFRMPW